MTFALGRRFIIVDGVERWKDKELDALEAALKAIPPDTTVAFFAREDSRAKAPKRLARRRSQGRRGHQRRAGSQAVGAAQVGDRARPRAGLAARAGRGPGADRARRRSPATPAARAREASARRSRPGARVCTAADVERADRAVGRAQGMVAGGRARRRRRRALRPAIYLALRAQGERVPGLLYWMAQRLRAGPRDRARRSKPAAPVARSSADCGCPLAPRTG